MINCSSDSKLREYVTEAWYGMDDGTLTGPLTMAPFTTTSSPATVASTFPPVSAARSITTLPDLIIVTVSVSINNGA